MWKLMIIGYIKMKTKLNFFKGPFSQEEMDIITTALIINKVWIDMGVPSDYTNEQKMGISSLYERIIANSGEIPEKVNHPAHYINEQGKECIDAMQEKFGVKAVYEFCRCNEFKYLWRAGKKGPKEEDTKKAEWYHKKALQLKTDYPILFKTYD